VRHSEQLSFLEEVNYDNLYLPILTAVENAKGVLDVDTVKGCTQGMNAHPDGAREKDPAYAQVSKA